ncbi:MAG: AmmeMemoRadiSam system protein B [Candidatus Aenigmarchaeota archaeon]|nr:AmmeMemoRadiSam system protein B [Candidatus Aenigmarchaeota archaeon]
MLEPRLKQLRLEKGISLYSALTILAWQTPLGVVKTNKAIADTLGIGINESSHKFEHSAEVQLPFLQVLYKNFTVVPICLSDIGMEELNNIAKKLAACRSSSFYIASSDFIHFGSMYAYEPIGGSTKDQVEWVRKKDAELIEKICKLDAEGFYNEIATNEYTVCGFVPITLLLLVMKRIGAKKGSLIKYMTSYDTQMNDSFVSYAGIVFE